MGKQQQHDYHDYEGLQVATPDSEGLNYLQHSDKQTVVRTTEQHVSADEKILWPNSDFQSSSKSTANGRTFCGLSRRAFIIAIAIVAVVVVGAAVGGGVGSAMSGKHSSSLNADEGSVVTTQTSNSAGNIVTVTVTSSSSSSNTTTDSTSSMSSSTSSSASSPSATGLGAYNCPADNNTIHHPSVNPDIGYIIICDYDQPDGFTGIDGNKLNDLNTGVVATSIESCIDACAGYTFKGEGDCTAVTYDVNITKALNRDGITGNCFFKDQRAKNLLAATKTGQVVSACTV